MAYGPECKNDSHGADYRGQTAVTITGKKCQHWSSQFPHAHNLNNSKDFPDATVADAQNFCRNPHGVNSAPWCFTTDPGSRWELCDIPLCNIGSSQLIWCINI